jgi:hypothetical protein
MTAYVVFIRERMRNRTEYRGRPPGERDFHRQ